jgi:hypothetical protein
MATDLRGIKWLPKKPHAPPGAICEICGRVAYFENGRFAHATYDRVTASHEPIPERKRVA